MFMLLQIFLAIGTVRLIVLWVLQSKADEVQAEIDSARRAFKRESETGSLLSSARKR